MNLGQRVCIKFECGVLRHLNTLYFSVQRTKDRQTIEDYENGEKERESEMSKSKRKEEGNIRKSRRKKEKDESEALFHLCLVL